MVFEWIKRKVTSNKPPQERVVLHKPDQVAATPTTSPETEQAAFDSWQKENPNIVDVTLEQWRKHMKTVEEMNANKEDMMRRIAEMAAFVAAHTAVDEEHFNEKARAGTETLRERYIRIINTKDTDWETELENIPEKYLAEMKKLVKDIQDLRSEAQRILGEDERRWSKDHLDPDGVPEWKPVIAAFQSIPNPRELEYRIRAVERKIKG